MQDLFGQLHDRRPNCTIITPEAEGLKLDALEGLGFRNLSVGSSSWTGENLRQELFCAVRPASGPGPGLSQGCALNLSGHANFPTVQLG